MKKPASLTKAAARGNVAPDTRKPFCKPGRRLCNASAQSTQTRRAAFSGEPRVRKPLALGLGATSAKIRAALDGWLFAENISYAQVLVRLTRRFGVATSATALSEYYARRGAELRALSRPAIAEGGFEILLRVDKRGRVTGKITALANGGHSKGGRA